MTDYFVKAFCSWLSHEQAYHYFLRYSKNGQGKWDNIQLVQEFEKANYYFIINYISEQDAQFLNKIDFSRAIVFQMEPKIAVERWNFWSKPPRASFLQVRNHETFPNNIEWHVSGIWEELEQTKNISKTRDISVVFSAKNYDPGHIKRIDFLRYIQERDPDLIDVYGTCDTLGFENYKGSLPHMDKSSALMPYKYHFNAENNAEYNYISEKCADAIICETLIFYYGAPNVEEFFPGAVIPLALEDFEADYDLIVRSIDADEHAKRLPAIQQAKCRIMNEYSIYPTLRTVITSASKCRGTYCLNLERRPDRRNIMEARMEQAGLRYKFWPAVDGKMLEITPEILHLFRGNDFGYKRGVIGCALSHVKMWQSLVADEEAEDNDYLLIIEDDAEFLPEFPRYFDSIVMQLYEQAPAWDMLFLGYHMFDEDVIKYWDLYKKTAPGQAPKIAKLNTQIYIGGIHCYMVSKSGARKLCDFIEKKGIQHGIDYIYKKYEAEMGIELYETRYQLSNAKWVRYYSTGDTDIQIGGDEVKEEERYRILYPWNDVLDELRALAKVLT